MQGEIVVGAREVGDGVGRDEGLDIALEGFGGQGATANSADRAQRNRLTGSIEDVTFLGSVVRIKTRIGDSLLSLDTFNNPGVTPPERGSSAAITFSPADVLL